MRFFVVIALLLSLLWIPLGWKKARGPSARHFLRPVSESFLQEGLGEDVLSILDQPFASWEKGSQAEVFLSRDGEWVLKLPRDKRARSCLLGRFHRSRTNRWFESYWIAGRYLPEEAALAFVHRGAPIDLPKGFVLLDRLGRTIRYDAKVPFALQRHLPLLSETLKHARQDEEAKEILSALLDLIARERQKGWVCADFAFALNYGYLQKRAYRIDIGSYLPEEGRFDWNEITKPVRRYLERNGQEELYRWWNLEVEKRSS